MLRCSCQEENQRTHLVTVPKNHSTLYCWRILRKILLLLIYFFFNVSVRNTQVRGSPNWETRVPMVHSVGMHQFVFRRVCGIWSLARKLLSTLTPTRGLRGQWDLLNKIAQLYILSEGTIQNKDAERGLSPQLWPGFSGHDRDCDVCSYVILNTLWNRPLPRCPHL